MRDLYYNASYRINASLLNLIMQIIIINIWLRGFTEFNKASRYNTELLNLLTRY